MNIFNLFKKHKSPVVHNCPINIKTGDGEYMGRCWHTTYDHICPTHGNVKDAIDLFNETGQLTKE